MDFQDWMSITVAMLGVISAAVICWQVYVLIDMRQYKKDFDKLRLDIEVEKQTQRNALREFAAETRLLEAGRIIGSFDEKKGNHAVIGIGYCSLIHALKLLINSKNEMIDETLRLMRHCIFLAKFYNAWDKMLPESIEELSKNEYHFITSGLLGVSDYVSQIDRIREWRRTQTMDEVEYKKAQEELISNSKKK